MSSITNANTTSESRTRDDIGVYPAAFGLSLGIASLFNALLVLVKESNSTILALMNSAGNHWVTQSIFDLIIFVVLGLALTKSVERWRYRPNAVIVSAVGGIVIGGLIIAGFNLIHAWGRS